MGKTRGLRGILRGAGIVALTACAAGDPSQPSTTKLSTPKAEGPDVVAGVPPDGCADGFAYDGDGGCTPILPAAVCPAGEMAVPGDVVCHTPSPCVDGPWGGIPSDGTTEYVDGAYAGAAGPPDGSRARPWPTIQQGLDAAASGAVVALAGGGYAFDRLTFARSVRLWGTCAPRVHLFAAEQLLLASGGASIELHALTFDDDVQIRTADETATAGLDVLVDGGQFLGTVMAAGMNLRVRRSILTGMRVVSSTVTLDAVEARGSTLTLDESALTLTGSYLHDAPRWTIHGVDASVDVDASVLRRCHSASAYDVNDVIEHGAIVFAGSVGQDHRVHVSRSVLDDNEGLGISVIGMPAYVEATVISGTRPRRSDGDDGIAIAADKLALEAGTLGSRVVVMDSKLVGNTLAAIWINASDLTAEGLLVRDTQPGGVRGLGRGLDLERDAVTGVGAHADVRRSVFEGSHESGVAVLGADATFDQVVVRDTHTDPRGDVGDGIAAELSTVAIRRSWIVGSARAGVSNFGGTVTIGATMLDGNAIDLDGEDEPGSPYAYDDVGGNVCTANGRAASCVALSSRLTAPEALAAAAGH